MENLRILEASDEVGGGEVHRGHQVSVGLQQGLIYSFHWEPGSSTSRLLWGFQGIQDFNDSFSGIAGNLRSSAIRLDDVDGVGVDDSLILLDCY